MRRSVPKALRRFLSRNDGSASVEFVILFPVVFSVFMMGVEVGWIAVQRVALDRAVDLSIRDVRLGRLPAQISHAEFRDRLCAQATLLANCETRLLIEMQRINMTDWSFPAERNACIDLGADIVPATAFSIGASSTIMYLRACYLVRPIFPTTGWGLQLPLDPSGMFALRTTTGFMNE